MHRARAATLGLLCAALACGEEPPPPEPIVRPIKILELEDVATGEQLEFPGTIQAGMSAALGFEVPGKIIELPAKEGASVEEGDLIARVDPRDYQADLDAAKALRAAAEAELERARALFEADATSKQEVETKRRNFEIAQARVATASKAVADTRLLAPFDGVVARVAVDNFENVQAKQQVVLVQNDSLFEVEVAVPEQDAARIRPDLSLDELTARGRPTVEISSLPGRIFEARLSELATSADPETRTYAATFVFENPRDVAIRSGMTAKITVFVPGDLPGVQGLRIPSVAAVADEQGGFHVWVVDPATMSVARRNVELGPLGGDSVLVRSGLEGTEWIAISGVHHLREGMTISRLGT